MRATMFIIQCASDQTSASCMLAIETECQLLSLLSVINGTQKHKSFKQLAPLSTPLPRHSHSDLSGKVMS